MNIRPSPPWPGEPRFLSDQLSNNTWTLVRDFVNFTLVLVFYGLCWSLGAAAFMFDNMFSTRLFERFIRFIEFLDNGGR